MKRLADLPGAARDDQEAGGVLEFAFFDDIDGTEWWGMFLPTVHVPDERRLTVILGSQTD